MLHQVLPFSWVWARDLCPSFLSARVPAAPLIVFWEGLVDQEGAEIWGDCFYWHTGAWKALTSSHHKGGAKAIPWGVHSLSPQGTEQSGGRRWHSLLFFCTVIKTSIFSSISFCISFEREPKTRILLLKSLELPSSLSPLTPPVLYFKNSHQPWLRGIGHVPDGHLPPQLHSDSRVQAEAEDLPWLLGEPEARSSSAWPQGWGFELMPVKRHS